MAKFNREKKSIEQQLIQRPDATLNFEDGLAFEQSAELRLYRMACASLMGEDKFYQTAQEHDKDVFVAIDQVEDSKYLLKLARYVRSDMHLRSVPVVLLAEAATRQNLKGTGLLRSYVPHILKRADEPTELVAYWLNKYGKPIPNALKRGIADTLRGFDAYQLGKYRASDKQVKLKDVVRLCARHLIEEGNVFHQLVEDKLRSEGTWERVISERGSAEEAWRDILQRMGLMAILRNLRNMLNAGVDTAAIKAKFTDDAILKSKQLPFRWYSAYKVLQGVASVDAPEMLDVLNHALAVSCRVIEPLTGTTFIAIDHSGSMDSPLSRRSTVSYFEAGAVLGAITQQVCQRSIVGLFGEHYQTVQLPKTAGILANVAQLRATDVGHSTEAWKAINWLNDNNIVADRIIILTDMQVYNRTDTIIPRTLYGELVRYRQTMNPKIRTYIFDMAGYSMSAVPEDDVGVTQLAGWSDRIFDFVQAVERAPVEILTLINERF